MRPRILEIASIANWSWRLLCSIMLRTAWKHVLPQNWRNLESGCHHLDELVQGIQVSLCKHPQVDACFDCLINSKCCAAGTKWIKKEGKVLRPSRKEKQRANDILGLCKELGFYEKDGKTLANSEWEKKKEEEEECYLTQVL